MIGGSIAVLDVRIASRCVSKATLSIVGRWQVTRMASNSARSSSAVPTTSDLRNVSFWGHIDAGKTTLTEKVLYLANALSPPDPTTANGQSSSSAARMMPGDVDSGSTVTDYLEAERQRGITIQSAAVGPFAWSPLLSKSKEQARIMLIDTPGHIDFTIEVERSLRVADGCVVLVDGVEGVESQTEGVWKIAKRYNVRSHVVFVNKMDRTGSSLRRSIQSIVRAKLHQRPTLLQLPVFGRKQGSSAMDEQTLNGLVDLTASPIAVQFYGGKAGEDVEIIGLRQAVESGRVDAELEREARSARMLLIEGLANLDEELLEESLAAMDNNSQGNGSTYTDQISTESVRRAIRRLTIKGEVLPVLCGSAARGVGVQPVLDAIVDFLPSPEQAGDMDAAVVRTRQSGCVWGQVQRGTTANVQKNNQKGAVQSVVDDEKEIDEQNVSISIADEALSLLAFKVVWDKRKGPMTFVRIYSGTLDRSSTLLNTNTGARERLNKILFVYADRHVETDRLRAGQIGVLLGLRDTRTGDTLVDVKAAMMASKAGKRARQANHRSGDDSSAAKWITSCNTLRLRRVNVPPPVFSMSIEAMSKSDEAPLREALDMLIRTDPSLHLNGGGAEGDGAGALGSIAASTGGQMVLSGMGELHLEIARDRLTNEFNARAHLGDVRVSYRETADDRGGSGAQEATTLVELLDRDVMGQRLKAECQIAIRNLKEEEQSEAHHGGNVIVIDEIQSDESAEDGQAQSKAARSGSQGGGAGETNEDVDASIRALQAGLVASLSRGPTSGNPLTGIHVHVSSVKSFGPAMSPPKAFSLLGAQALRAAIKERGAVLMEPFMNVRISSDESSLGKVVGNLTSVQDGTVERVDHAEDTDAASESEADSDAENVYLPANASLIDGISHVDADSLTETGGRNKCTIIATVPLVNLVRYSSTLRALTRGMATYEMSFNGFAVVTPDRQRAILSSLGRI